MFLHCFASLETIIFSYKNDTICIPWLNILTSETEPTLPLQQRGVQQLHHVLNLRIQLRHVTLSHHIRQHGQEVVGTVHPAWKEADGEAGRCGALAGQLGAAEVLTNAAIHVELVLDVSTPELSCMTE